MAAGRAEAIYRETGKPVAIVDRHKQRRSHPIWQGNPAIDRLADQELLDAPGARPYIERWENGRIVFADYSVMQNPPGPIPLTKATRTWARNVIQGREVALIQTTTKREGSGKDWGVERWRAVADELANDIDIFEFGPDIRSGRLRREFIHTPTIKHAAAIVEQVTIVLTPEGGVHHLAGAMGTPAVVVFGGFISPDTTGYAHHINLFADGPDSPCGVYSRHCDHCDEALARITPADVVAAARDKLAEVRGE